MVLIKVRKTKNYLPKVNLLKKLSSVLNWIFARTFRKTIVTDEIKLIRNISLSKSELTFAEINKLKKCSQLKPKAIFLQEGSRKTIGFDEIKIKKNSII